jgi:hypothetical protein
VTQHLLGAGEHDSDPAALGPLTYLLRSGLDRIGALDVQERSDAYVSRDQLSAPLEDLMGSRRPRRRGPGAAAGA